jgi:glycosyltransferase involved in cell wall biosynthesis
MPDVVMLRSRAFPPEPRGLREARVLREAGLSVEVVAWDRAREFPAKEVHEGIEVSRVRVPCGESLLPAYLLALPLFWLVSLPRCLREGVRAVHCADLDTLPVGLLAKRLRGTKVVYDAYEDYAGMVAAVVPGLLASLLARIDRRLSRAADLVVTVSPPLLERFAGAGETLLVPNSADPEEFDRVGEGEVAEFRKKHGVEGSFLVLFVGVLMPGRGIEHTAAAVEPLEGVKFVIGGFGKLGPEVRRIASGSKNTVFIGRLRPDEVPVAVRAADALVEVLDPANGTYRVAMPNKLFDSLMAGVPFVVSRDTYPGEFVEKNGTGIAVPYGDIGALRAAIERLRAGRGAARWKERAAPLRDSHAWKVYARDLKAAYLRLLA